MSVPNSTRIAALPAVTPVQAHVLAELAKGTTVTEAARQAGIHRSTFYNWLRNIPALAEALEAANRTRIASVYDQILELADTALDTIRHILGDENATPALKLRAALALLRMVKQTPPPPPIDPGEKKENTTRITPTAPPKTPRNGPCPCGSGQKYKRCCGTAAPPVLYEPVHAHR